MSEKNLRLTIKLKNGSIIKFSSKKDGLISIDFGRYDLSLFFLIKQSLCFDYQAIEKVSLSLETILTGLEHCKRVKCFDCPY